MLATGCAILFLLGIYAALIEPFTLRVRHYEVASAGWGTRKPLKIALISDPHVIWPWMTPRHLEKIVARTQALHPDMVLLLGDYVATHPFGLAVSAQDGVAPFKALSAPCGIYAVLGNHDLHPPSDWPAALAATGIPVLGNKALRTACGAEPFWIAGLEDLYWQHADVEKTMEQASDGAPVILMMHNPDSFAQTPSSVVLAVAGHTHGGQVRLPWIGALSAVIPSKYGKRYAYGHIVENNRHLIVSGGIGATGLPIRFLAPPEIVLVTLTGTINLQN